MCKHLLQYLIPRYWSDKNHTGCNILSDRWQKHWWQLLGDSYWFCSIFRFTYTKDVHSFGYFLSMNTPKSRCGILRHVHISTVLGIGIQVYWPECVHQYFLVYAYRSLDLNVCTRKRWYCNACGGHYRILMYAGRKYLNECTPFVYVSLWIARFLCFLKSFLWNWQCTASTCYLYLISKITILLIPQKMHHAVFKVVLLARRPCSILLMFQFYLCVSSEWHTTINHIFLPAGDICQNSVIVQEFLRGFILSKTEKYDLRFFVY